MYNCYTLDVTEYERRGAPPRRQPLGPGLPWDSPEWRAASTQSACRVGNLDAPVRPGCLCLQFRRAEPAERRRVMVLLVHRVGSPGNNMLCRARCQVPCVFGAVVRCSLFVLVGPLSTSPGVTLPRAGALLSVFQLFFFFKVSMYWLRCS